MAQKQPFHEENYRRSDAAKGCCPLIDIRVGASEETLLVYVDTGCTTGLALLKSQVGKLDIGNKISDDLYTMKLANGGKIDAEIHRKTVELKGVKKEVEIKVILPETYREANDTKGFLPLLGRGFIDHFDVTFKGKEKKIEFFHP